MTRFSDGLYDDLMREHGPLLAATRPHATPQRHRTPRRVALAAGAGGLAVAAAAGSLLAAGGPPAYAMTTNHGTIRLAVFKEAGIAQVNAKLRSSGARVIVVPVRAGCPSIDSVRKPAVPVRGKVQIQGSEGEDGSITVHANGVPRGDVILVATETSGKLRETASTITSEPVPHCVSLPTPPASGNGSSHGTTG